MWLAGIPVADKAVLQLAATLREAELVDTADRLERAYDREARIVALDVPDREAILRVLEECPEGLLELRATLLQERVWPTARRARVAHTLDGRIQERRHPAAGTRLAAAARAVIARRTGELVAGTLCRSIRRFMLANLSATKGEAHDTRLRACAR